MSRKNGFLMGACLLLSGLLSVAGVVYYYEVYKAAESNTVEFSSRTVSRQTEESAEEVTLDVISDGDSTQMVYEAEAEAVSETAAQDPAAGSETEAAVETAAVVETVIQTETAASVETVAPAETAAAEETVVQEEIRYAGEDDFIISNSDSVVLTAEDIADMTAKELNYARNEIYARKGRKFQSQELQDYFNSKSWYSGTIDPSSFTDSLLTDVERANTNLLLEREKELTDGQTYSLDKNSDTSDVRILR